MRGEGRLDVDQRRARADLGVVPALAQNGVRYLSDGPNYLDRIGYARVTWEDKPFWWISPSGREKVLYWAPYFGYAYGHTVDLLPEAVQRDLKHLEEIGYPYDLVQVRWSKGDNGSADERVMDQVRQWNATHAYPHLIIATTSEAFHAFEQRYGDKLPSYRGDFTPYWEDGAASGARETAMNRHSADRLSQAETLWVLRSPGPYPPADFAAAWKNVALWSEHTWRLQQHQPARSALRQDPVEIQAGVRLGCPAAIAAVVGKVARGGKGRGGRRGRAEQLFVAADGTDHPSQGNQGKRRARRRGPGGAVATLEHGRTRLPGTQCAAVCRQAVYLRRGSLDHRSAAPITAS